MGKSFISIAVLCVLGVLISGCVDRQKRHKVLTFFFTGVPPLKEEKRPSEEKEAQGVKTIQETSPPKLELFSHKPYADKQCQKCHQTSAVFGRFRKKSRLSIAFKPGSTSPGLLVVPLEEICTRCHTHMSPSRVHKEKLWLHAPAAAGKCTMCHNPHQSPNPNMLVKNPRQICSQCHSNGLIMANTDSHKSPKACLECHNAHLGKNMLMLTRDYKELKHPVGPLSDPSDSQAMSQPTGTRPPSSESGAKSEIKPP